MIGKLDGFQDELCSIDIIQNLNIQDAMVQDTASSSITRLLMMNS